MPILRKLNYEWKVRMNRMMIKNKELATDLVTLAIMCAKEETDNCDIILTTSFGKINCHIEFSEVENSAGMNE